VVPSSIINHHHYYSICAADPDWPSSGLRRAVDPNTSGAKRRKAIRDSRLFAT